MQEVRVGKEKLREIMQHNRDEHRGIYERAIEGYKQAAVRFFEHQLDRARDGKTFQRAFGEPMPEDHTEDYDTILAMLDLSEDDDVVLTEHAFRQYVQDEWGWKQQFNTVSSNYISNN